jgi:hypothetical protein
VSRESGRCRAREREQALEDAIGRGVTLELLGIRFVVLFAEQSYAPPSEPRPGAATRVARSRPRSA